MGRALHDFAAAVVLDSNGNVAVTGRSHNGANDDYYSAKYAAADGALLWEQRYNGPANNTDQATSLVVDVSGNVVVTGFSHNGNNYDYYTAKYAATNGSLLWEMRYDGLGNDTVNERKQLALTRDGGVVVTGDSTGGASVDFTTIYYAPATPP